MPYAVNGDESVSWTASALAQGAPAPVHIVVVRQGATIVRFMAIDLSGRAPATVTVPHEVADQQLDKLARTVRGLTGAAVGDYQAVRGDFSPGIRAHSAR